MGMDQSIIGKCAILICLLFGILLFIHTGENHKIGGEKPTIILPIIDKIELRQKEMRDTTVFVKTRSGNGSGTIIDRLNTDVENIFEYRVLTNAHVVYPRFTESLIGVNSITGTTKIKVVDTGCEVIAFYDENKEWDIYIADIVSEDWSLDLAILSFVSDKKLSIAMIADDDMLKQIRIFDEVFAIGCQLGQTPSPTVGIVSQILIGTNNKQKWTVYGSTAQISPGSSGGGLFKEYDDHYYLIGIPHITAVTKNGQFVPHLSSAISIIMANNFINDNSVTYP